MPRTKKGTPPAYRQHSSGQAIVTVRTTSGNRRDILLGAWDSPQSRTEYARILTLLNANSGRYPEETVAPDGLSINEVILAWWKDAEGRMGKDCKELQQYKYALRLLRALYGHLPAEAFSPK